MIRHCLTSPQNCLVREVNSQLRAFHSSLKRETEIQMGEREIQAWEKGGRPRMRGGGTCGNEILRHGWKDLPRTNSFHPLSSAGRRQTLAIVAKNYLRHLAARNTTARESEREREMKIIERDGEEWIK